MVNGKIYVGKTKNPNTRWTQHISAAKTKGKNYQLIHRALNKYGLNNFDYKVIQKLNSDQNASLAEKYWIQFYKTYIKKFGNDFGYNLTKGGEGNTNIAGENNSNSKLSSEQVIEIKSSNLKTKQLISIYGVSRTTIQRIRSGKLWTDLNTSINTKKPTNKLGSKIVENIRNMYNTTNLDIKSIKKSFNISQSLVSQILNNIIWKNNNFKLSDLAKEKLSYSRQGDKNSNAKLTIEQVILIRQQYTDGVTITQLKNIYDVSFDCISNIVKFKSWKFS